MYLHPAFARALGEETRAEHLRRAQRPAPARRVHLFRFGRRIAVRDGPPVRSPAPAPAIRA